MDGAATQQTTGLGDQVGRATKLVAEGKYPELVDLADEIERAASAAPTVSVGEARELRRRLTALADVMGHVSLVLSALRQIGTPSEASYGADGSLESNSHGTLRGEA